MALTIAQETHQVAEQGDIQEEKQSVKRRKCEVQDEQAQDLWEQLNPQLQGSIELVQEKGLSTWLTVCLWLNMVFNCTRGVW